MARYPGATVAGVARGALTSAKAAVNGVATAAVETATLGFHDGPVRLWGVDEEDLAYGYEQPEGAGTVLGQFAIGAGIGRLATMPGRLGKAALMFDAQSNGAQVGHGLRDGDPLQAAGGLAGMGGLLAGAKGALRARKGLSPGSGGRNAPVRAPGRGLASTIGGQPIDAAALARMRAAFERSGGTILQGADIDEYLLWRARQMGASNVGGLTDNAKQILLPTNPLRSAVFEEFIHTAQYRTGKVSRLIDQFGNDEAERLLEIEAAEKLIRNRGSWRLPNDEVRAAINRLRRLRARGGSSP
ncbi:MAG: hypothetical protein KatS3mg108_1003 [Isosphaeraceae bacterium]|nr:MAG: hypothetical protein KatS3mg108_1003 [Isosphaeraceae bacterium]